MITDDQQDQSYEDDDNDEEVKEAAPERPLWFQVESAIDLFETLLCIAVMEKR